MMSQPQIVITQPVARPVEGHPIGNGRMGTLVWTTPGTVEFQINRVGAGGQVTAPDERTRILRLPAARGTRTILVASAASGDDRANPGAAAERILGRMAAPEALAALEQGHRRWWQSFGQRTFVEIHSPDGRGEQAARDRRLFLYHMASTSRGAFPPKWNGSIFLTDGDKSDWGAQFWLWTTEMLYWPLHAADASDLAEPFFEMYHRALPAMTVAARQRWNANGLFLPEVMPFDGPTELPVDLVAEYRDIFRNGRANTGISPPLAAACAYDQHLSTLLYAADKHPGAYSWASHLASSGAELAVHAWWRYRFTSDVAWLLSHAYPLLRGVAEFYRSYCRKGEDGRWHIHGTNAHEDFWGVTDSIMDLAAIRSPIAAIRSGAGAGEELPEILDRYRAAFKPLANGFSLFEHYTPNFQAHSIEHLGLLTMTLQEALLQSVSPRPGEPEVIRVFPAWPKAWDAEFKLIARGGFVVTAAIRGGEIQTVEILSRHGEECRIRNPWPGPCRITTSQSKPVPHSVVSGGLLVFQTERGCEYRIVRNAPAEESL